MTFRAFPSIEQFRNVVKAVHNSATYVGLDEAGEPVYDGTRPRPTIAFCGTVKVHGTNAGITRTSDGRFIAQSRSKELVAPDDNFGFRAWMDELPPDVLETMFAPLLGLTPLDHFADVTIFGEWAGKGVQQAVAVSQVERFFYVFAAKIGDDWVDASDVPEFPFHRVFNSMAERFAIGNAAAKMDFVAIDFNDPEAIARAQNLLGEITQSVEEECPVGKAFGVSGVGEGVVWESMGIAAASVLRFKVKGEKHSVTKTKTLASVDVEKVKTAVEFVDRTVTENRLRQGIEVLKEQGKAIDRSSLGDFIKWVSADVMKEELDTLTESGMVAKDVNGQISTKARTWFFANFG